MPRKPRSDAIRLLEGRGNGRDSGGRLVKPATVINDYGPPLIAPTPRRRDVAPPPRMPAGLPAPVKKEWRRVVKELQELGAVMPPQDVLEDFCRVVVEQHTVAVALGVAVPGSVQWSRLTAREDRLAKRIAGFIREYYCAPPVAPVSAGSFNPFASAPDSAGRRRKTPSLTKGLSSRPMPAKYWESPTPPLDPRYHAAWVKNIRESDKNHGIIRPPGFYRREFHYDINGNLWDEYQPAPDKPDDDGAGWRDE